MPQYRIYTLLSGNKIVGATRIITCETDAQAIERARSFLENRDIEIWQGARVVARLQPRDTK